jgi:hypothetical protein
MFTSYSQGFGEGFDEGWALVNEGGVDLDEGGTGAEFLLSVFDGGDAADADDGNFSGEVAGEGAEDFGAFGEDGDAG